MLPSALRLLPSLRSEADARDALSMARLRRALTSADATGAELLRHARACGASRTYVGGDASAEAADDEARAALAAQPPEWGVARPGEIDVLRDVVGPAERALQRHPVPPPTVHKPFEESLFTRRIAGAPTLAGGGIYVTEDELERAQRLLEGFVAFRPEGVARLRQVLLLLLAERSGGDPTYAPKEDRSLDYVVMLKRMRAMPPRLLPDDEHTAALRALLHSLDSLGRRQGAALNAMLRERHSTFGRFFTGPDILQALADRLVRVGRLDPARDVYVDFSCGTNEFGAMLGLRRWVGFDILPPATNACAAHFRLVNFFDVDELPPNAVIGLNPPFGVGGDTAAAFVSRALRFRPRLLALIVPRSSVRSMLARSIEFRRKLLDANRSHPACREYVAAVAAGRAPPGARHPALVHGVAGPLPPFLLVDYESEVTKGASFYMPASLTTAIHSGGRTGPSGRRVATGAAADWSGDFRAPAAAAAQRARESVSDRGIPIRPDDMPEWFVFQAARDVVDDRAVVEGPSDGF